MSDPLGTPIGDTTPPTESGLREVNNATGRSSTVEQPTPVESYTEYIPFSDQNVNVAIQDAYDGGGGFKGDIGNKRNFYSYVVAKPTENYPKTRISLNQYINFFAAYIDAKVDPVFSFGVRDYVTLRDSLEEIVDDPWVQFTVRANNSGVSLNDLRCEESKHAHKDDMVYLIMDKVENEAGEKVVSETFKKAVDVDGYSVNPKTMLLDSITFWEANEAVVGADGELTGEVIFVKHRWKKGKQVELKSQPASPQTQRDSQTLKFKETGEFPTGISSMNVYPMTPIVPEYGCYKPVLPKSYDVARLCADIHNARNILAYLLFKQGHSLLVFQGKTTGLRDPLSNVVEIPAGSPDQTVAMPEILSPDAELPRAHMEQIRETFEYMVSIMGHNGVSVVEKKAESGASKAYDMVGTNQTLLSTVEMNKKADVWRKKIFNEFEDRTDQYEYHTEYPKDFYPTTGVELQDLIEVADWFVQQGQLKAATRAAKLLATTFFKEIPREELIEIIDSIEIEEEASDIPPRKPATGDEDE
jgi:hypothetical protein